MSPDYFELSSLDADRGRLFNEDEDRRFAQVAVLGSAAARELFPNGGAVGEHVKVNHLWLEVVGVLRDRQLPDQQFEGREIGGESGHVYLPLQSGLSRLKREELSAELDQLKLRLDGSLDPSERPVGVCYAGDPKSANYSPRGIGLTNTLRTWLSMWSLKESHCRGAPHLQRIKLPALVIQSLADTGVFPSDARGIHDALGSTDKRLEFVTGDHYLEHPATARDHVADMIAAWVGGRV